MAKKSQYKPGEHPNSRKNLEKAEKQGRPKLYGDEKKRREISITDQGWDGLKAIAGTIEKQSGEKLSTSELIERIGRGIIKLDLSATDEKETQE